MRKVRQRAFCQRCERSKTTSNRQANLSSMSACSWGMQSSHMAARWAAVCKARSVLACCKLGCKHFSLSSLSCLALSQGQARSTNSKQVSQSRPRLALTSLTSARGKAHALVRRGIATRLAAMQQVRTMQQLLAAPKALCKGTRQLQSGQSCVLVVSASSLPLSQSSTTCDELRQRQVCGSAPL